MADKPNIRSADDSLHQLVKTEQEQVLPKIVAKPTEEVENAQPAKDFQSTGRNTCPQCRGRLVHFELNTETSVLWVKCTGVCGRKWSHPDLEDPESDALFRHIPESLILEHVRRMEARNK
jgi:hypothetical protein